TPRNKNFNAMTTREQNLEIACFTLRAHEPIRRPVDRFAPQRGSSSFFFRKPLRTTTELTDIGMAGGRYSWGHLRALLRTSPFGTVASRRIRLLHSPATGSGRGLRDEVAMESPAAGGIDLPGLWPARQFLPPAADRLVPGPAVGRICCLRLCNHLHQ